MADDPDTPTAGPPSNRTEAALLSAYLADRDIPCPACGYSLRGLKGGTCPECGRELSLDLGVNEPAWGIEQRALAVLLLYLLVFGFLTLAVVVDGRPGDPIALFPALIAGSALVGLVRYALADARRCPRACRIATNAALVTSLLALTVFFLTLVAAL